MWPLIVKYHSLYTAAGHQVPKLCQLQVLHCSEGKEIRVMDTVAGKWEDLAMALHFDGPTILTIKKDSALCSKTACFTVLQRWLEGKGRQPACWDILLKALKDAEFRVLARELTEALQQMEH